MSEQIFPISECVPRCKLTKVEFKEGTVTSGSNKGKKYEGLVFTFNKDGMWFKGPIWAVNPQNVYYKGDIEAINRDIEISRSRIEQIGSIFLRDNGKMVELKSWLEGQEEKNFKVFAKKFIEYLEYSDMQSTLVDIKLIPREKGGEVVPSFPFYGSFIRKAGDKSIHLLYSQHEKEEYEKLILQKH